MRIALKVDCDTAEGTRRGVPRLLSLFDRRGIRASFFFSLGPDRSGRAAIRVFTRKGFLRKMLRSRAPSLYGWRTMLSGTLLPAPVIGRVAREEIRSAAAGHEVGIHAWDHVGWHDGLARWDRARIELEYGKLNEAFRDIFGREARSSAAPGWTVSEPYLEIRERFPLLYTSDTRGGTPFLPALTGGASEIPEIPSTLPTLDEMLGDPRFPDARSLAAHFTSLPEDGALTVHTIHAEVEGGPYQEWFENLLERWSDRGANFVTLEDAARQIRDPARPLEIRRIERVTLPGRAGTVASGFAAKAGPPLPPTPA